MIGLVSESSLIVFVDRSTLKNEVLHIVDSARPSHPGVSRILFEGRRRASRSPGDNDPKRPRRLRRAALSPCAWWTRPARRLANRYKGRSGSARTRDFSTSQMGRDHQQITLCSECFNFASPCADALRKGIVNSQAAVQRAEITTEHSDCARDRRRNCLFDMKHLCLLSMAIK
jgi:hypothetical protein